VVAGARTDPDAQGARTVACSATEGRSPSGVCCFKGKPRVEMGRRGGASGLVTCRASGMARLDQ